VTVVLVLAMSYYHLSMNKMRLPSSIARLRWSTLLVKLSLW